MRRETVELVMQCPTHFVDSLLNMANLQFCRESSPFRASTSHGVLSLQVPYPLAHTSDTITSSWGPVILTRSPLAAH